MCIDMDLDGAVMPMLVTGIHANTEAGKKDVDGQNESGHDARGRASSPGQGLKIRPDYPPALRRLARLLKEHPR
jgi:hypothetical protein